MSKHKNGIGQIGEITEIQPNYIPLGFSMFGKMAMIFPFLFTNSFCARNLKTILHLKKCVQASWDNKF